MLITNLLGTVDVTDNGMVSNWVSDQLLKVMRTDITTQIVRNGWPILGLSAYTTDIERSVIAKGNEQLTNYGVAITRMGNFDINLSPEDSASLKKLASDTSYSRLAGSFNQYAAGEMALGAGGRHGPGRRGRQRCVPRRRARHRRRHGGRPVPAHRSPAPSGFAGGPVPAYAGPPPGGAAPARSPRARPRRPPSACATLLPDRQLGRRQVLPELRPGDGAAEAALHQLRQRAARRSQVLRRVRHADRSRATARPARRLAVRPV